MNLSKLFPDEDRRAPWQWADGIVPLKSSPLGKFFRPEMTPWLKEPLEVFADNRVREETVQCCVQGGKSTFLQVAAAWAMVHQPANMMFTCQTDEDAKDFARERFNPMIEGIDVLRAKVPEDKTKRSVCSLSLPEMFCVIQGANLSNLQSKSIRWLFNDEVFLWKDGLLDHARKRTTQFWNRRIVNASTAGDDGCDMDRAHLAGDCREYHFSCPICGKLFWPRWDCVKWPRQTGDWDFKLLRDETTLECPECKHRFEHTERNARLLIGGARYVAQNKSPTPGHVSFRWNATVLAPSTVSWGDLAVEWVKSEIEFEKGNEIPRKEFITKRLAESYNANRFVNFVTLPTVDKETEWEGEQFRVMTVDVQEMEFWALVQAWNADGESIVLWAGKLFSWEEVAAKQKEFEVRNRCVFVDCGNDMRRVWEQCAKHGEAEGRQWVCWNAMRGDSRKMFKNKYADKFRLQPFSWPPTPGDPMTGTKSQGKTQVCPVITWSNPTIKDIAKRRRDGKANGKNMVAQGVGDEFSKHMFSEQRVVEWNKRTGESVTLWKRIGKRPNHLWDCFCMAIVAACMMGVIGEGADANS